MTFPLGLISTRLGRNGTGQMKNTRAALIVIVVVGMLLGMTMLIIRVVNDNYSVHTRHEEVGDLSSNSVQTKTNKKSEILEAHEALRLLIEGPRYPNDVHLSPENTRFHIERHKPSKRWIIRLDWLHVVPDLESWVAVDDAGVVTDLPWGGVSGEEAMERRRKWKEEESKKAAKRK